MRRAQNVAYWFCEKCVEAFSSAAQNDVRQRKTLDAAYRLLLGPVIALRFVVFAVMASKNEKQVKFSSADDEQLIEIVSGYRILWEMKDPDFKNCVKKDRIWNEMDRMLNKSEGQCKTRWKSIRDHYKRQKKAEKNMPTGSAATKKRATYWDRLNFLNAVEDERESQSNIVELSIEETPGNESRNEINDDDQGDVGQTVADSDISERKNKREKSPVQTNTKTGILCAPPIKKTKTKQSQAILEIMKKRGEERQQLLQYVDKIVQPDETNEIDLFFTSIAATVKKFPAEDIPELKMKIFTIVSETEIRIQKKKANVPVCDIPVCSVLIDENSRSSQFSCESGRPDSQMSSISVSSNSNCGPKFTVLPLLMSPPPSTGNSSDSQGTTTFSQIQYCDDADIIWNN